VAKIENDQLIIVLDHAEGSTLKAIQEALILGIEKISCSENSGDEDHRDAVYWLSNIFRCVLLDESQTNVGLGNRPYQNPQS
jgi:hypothetical protein